MDGDMSADFTNDFYKLGYSLACDNAKIKPDPRYTDEQKKAFLEGVKKARTERFCYRNNKDILKYEEAKKRRDDIVETLLAGKVAVTLDPRDPNRIRGRLITLGKRLYWTKKKEGHFLLSLNKFDVKATVESRRIKAALNSLKSALGFMESLGTRHLQAETGLKTVIKFLTLKTQER